MNYVNWLKLEIGIKALILTWILSAGLNLFAHGDVVHEIASSQKTFKIADYWSSWEFDPSTPLGIIAIILYGVYFMNLSPRLRAERLKYFIAFVIGVVVLILATASVIDLLADYSFFFHMLQHTLIIFVAAFLVNLGRPFPALIKPFPSSVKKSIFIPLAKARPIRSVVRFFIQPIPAISIYIINIWVWHYPPLYQLAIVNDPVHYLQHFSFFITALAFWYNCFPYLATKVNIFTRVSYLFAPMTFECGLGAVIFFQNRLVYDFSDLELLGMNLYQHQQIGGLTMWVGGGFIYLFLFALLFREGYLNSLRLVSRET